MAGRRWLPLLAASLIVGACVTTTATPTRSPAATVSGGAVAGAHGDASLSHSGRSIEDLIGAPETTVSASDVRLTSPVLQDYFDRACAADWAKPNVSERIDDRETACLAVIASAYGMYVAGGRSDESLFDDALAAEQAAAQILGPEGKAYLDRGLGDLDDALDAPVPHPSGLATLSSLAATSHPSMSAQDLHAAIRDAMARDVGTLLVACKGSDLSGSRINPCLPFPLLQPTVDPDGDLPLSESRLAGAITACQYSPSLTGLQHEPTVRNCALAAVPFWLAYRATGRQVYWDALVAIRDQLWSKGKGREATEDIQDLVACYADKVPTDVTLEACSD